MANLQMPTTKEQFYYYLQQLEFVKEEWQTRKLRTLLNRFKMLFHQAELFGFSLQFINYELRLFFKHLIPYTIQMEVTLLQWTPNKEMEYFLHNFEQALVKRETCEYERKMGETFRQYYRYYNVNPPRVSNCAFCGKTDHQNYECPLDYIERVEAIQENKLCFSCLRPGHTPLYCTENIQCRHCGLDHYHFMCSRFYYSRPSYSRYNALNRRK